jgi:hypothetical protein
MLLEAPPPRSEAPASLRTWSRSCGIRFPGGGVCGRVSGDVISSVRGEKGRCRSSDAAFQMQHMLMETLRRTQDDKRSFGRGGRRDTTSAPTHPTLPPQSPKVVTKLQTHAGHLRTLDRRSRRESQIKTPPRHICVHPRHLRSLIRFPGNRSRQPIALPRDFVTL